MTVETGFEKQDRAARLVRVLQLLVGTPGGITAADIGKRTNRHKRTALRDIEALMEIHVPIEMDGDRYRLMPGYTLPTVAFTQPEMMAILLATRLAVQHMDYNNEFLAMALSKLAGTLPKGSIKVYVGESANQLANKPDNLERQKVFGVVTQGLLERKQLAFTYVDAQGQKTKRRVHPYFLEPVSLVAHGTYLVAKDIDRRGIRIFKLDRIVEARVLPEEAYVPGDFQLEKLVANSWGIWTNEKVETVQLVFAATVASRVRETVWHPSQKLEKLPDARLRFTVQVRGLVEILPWILGWGADVEVVGPAALRKTVAETATRTAAIYSSGA
jgi:predicted DNA-binding transcriptional regulator YafY